MGREVISEHRRVRWTCELCEISEIVDGRDVPLGWIPKAAYMDLDHRGFPLTVKKKVLCSSCAHFLIAATVACINDRSELGDKFARADLDAARKGT